MLYLELVAIVPGKDWDKKSIAKNRHFIQAIDAKAYRLTMRHFQTIFPVFR